MRRLTAFVLAVALLCGAVTPVFAQTTGIPCNMTGRPVSFNDETLTVTNATAVTLTQSKYVVGARVALAALLSVSGGPLNALDDGTAPTTSDGVTFSAGERFWACGESVSGIQLIATTATNSTVKVIYYAPR